MKLSATLGVVAVGAALVLSPLGIGGCGGSKADAILGGIVAPAEEPVCAATTKEAHATSQGRLAGAAGVAVPETTLERPEDLGLRAHTDHLIYRGGAGRGNGPQGLEPAQVRGVYGAPDDGGSGAIAIVTAFHAPTILADFNVFSSTFGLPQEGSEDATASANAVFQVVYSDGSRPTTNAGWAQEASLDTQWAHAMAPRAKIYLVEAPSTLLSDLTAAAALAKTLPGVRQVSMSFGATETACFYAQYDSVFKGSGVAFFAPSGDTAGERDYPALSREVVAVGGTSLILNADGSRQSETAWADAGAGKSRFSPRPPFQNGVVALVDRYRGACDVSAVADPQTGVSVYDSTPYAGDSGWLVIGGTSASTPIVAGIANAAGTTGLGSRDLAARIYANLGGSALFDVRGGKAGSFAAGPGWDFPTGAGVPNGLGAF